MPASKQPYRRGLGRHALDALVTHRVPLTSIAEAFEIYVGRREDALKVMLEVCTDAVRSAPEGEAERAIVARMVALAEELIASFDPLLRRRV